MATRVLIIAACLLFGGCTTLTDFGVVRKETLRNEQGHVIGYKEMLKSDRTGEVVAHVQLYTPVRDETGAVVGYEEQSRSGAVLRGLDGRVFGARFSDLRSRKGVTIVMRPADAPTVAMSKPKVWELMASLSASDLRRVQ